MRYIDEVNVFCDGGCKPNPGTAVGAFLITNDQNIIKGPIGKTFGEGTNIVAEFRAIEFALDEADTCTRKKVIVCCDNEFVVKVLNKKCRLTKARHLKPIMQAIYTKAQVYEEVLFTHVSENNRYIKKCDAECKKLLSELGP